jgi:hypothetical protein
MKDGTGDSAVTNARSTYYQYFSTYCRYPWTPTSGYSQGFSLNSGHVRVREIYVDLMSGSANSFIADKEKSGEIYTEASSNNGSLGLLGEDASVVCSLPE